MLDNDQQMTFAPLTKTDNLPPQDPDPIPPRTAGAKVIGALPFVEMAILAARGSSAAHAHHEAQVF